MKNLKFTGLLTFALALALLVGNSAFTSTSSSTKYYTPDGMGGYIDVTSTVLAENYQCNNSESECLVQFTDDDPQNGIKTVLERGIYEELP